MLITTRIAVICILSVIAVCPAYAEDKPAATVNGISIPQDRVDLRTKIVAAQQGQHDTPELRKAIIEDLVNVELMFQEALKKGLDKQSETVQQLVLAKQTVLADALVQDYVKAHPIRDEAIAKEYDNLKISLGTKEYHVRHILVENESEAKLIAAKLKKGGKENTYDKLAINSKDAGTKDQGGDWGWIPVGNIPNTLVKPLGDVLMHLKKGQVSEPVQSQFGWHIIKLDDVRDLKMPLLDEIKPQLTQRLQLESVKQLIADLRTKAKVE